MAAVTICCAVASCAAAALQPLRAQDPGTDLLSRERVEQVLPPLLRPAWLAYLEASEQLAQQDRELMERELRELGQRRWTPARQGTVLAMHDSLTARWFVSAPAQQLADVIVTWQTPSGGWSKRVDYAQGPRPVGTSFSVSDGWSYIGTFDNDATTGQLRFLAAAWQAGGRPQHRDAFLHGLDYVLRAQFPNGCWPQVYPLQGGYNDAVTFNDEAMVHVLDLLSDIASGDLGGNGLVNGSVRERARLSVERGIECIVASQVSVAGVRKAWGAQHDPLTLQPTHARAYEHASLSGGESAGVLRFLMQVDSPDARTIAAVHDAAAWFRSTAIHGYEYDMATGLRRVEGGGPVWARFYEIGTNRPIFSNRDGQVLYEWSQLEDERRVGYAWYRTSAQSVLREYERWARRFPKP